MKPRVLCPVCQIIFNLAEPVEEGLIVNCNICGAKVELTMKGSEINGRKAVQEPVDEITQRVETFADLKGYTFDENKALVLEGLMEKHHLFGDFFCPCRFENVPDNICPCLDTRMGRVRKDGHCRCGFFIRTDSKP